MEEMQFWDHQPYHMALVVKDGRKLAVLAALALQVSMPSYCAWLTDFPFGETVHLSGAPFRREETCLLNPKQPVCRSHALMQVGMAQTLLPGPQLRSHT